MSGTGLIALILAAAALTYATRAGGYLIINRFGAIGPRLEALLNAVPIAVLGALIAPAILYGGTAERLAGLVAAMASLRFSTNVVVMLGLGTLMLARTLLGS